MQDSDPQYLESQFLAAQAILEHTAEADPDLSSRVQELRDEAVEIITHVMRNGTLPVRG